MKIKKMSDKKLKELICEYYDLGYGENPSYGTKDLIFYDALLAEADKRKIGVSLKPTFY